MFKNKTVFIAYFKQRIYRDEKIQENEKVVKSDILSGKSSSN